MCSLNGTAVILFHTSRVDHPQWQCPLPVRAWRMIVPSTTINAAIKRVGAERRHALSRPCFKTPARTYGNLAGVVQEHSAEGSGQTPPEVRANQLAATVGGYRAQAIADGIPYRFASFPGVRNNSNGSIGRYWAFLHRPSCAALLCWLIICVHSKTSMETFRNIMIIYCLMFDPRANVVSTLPKDSTTRQAGWAVPVGGRAAAGPGRPGEHERV